MHIFRITFYFYSYLFLHYSFDGHELKIAQYSSQEYPIWIIKTQIEYLPGGVSL